MKIVLDGRIYGTGWTGIGRYTEQIITELQKLDHDNEYIVLLRKDVYQSWQPAARNFKKVLADYKPYGFKEQTLLPLRLYFMRPDLVHFFHFAVPVAYFKKYVVTIHDLTLVEYKNIRGSGFKKLIYEIKYWLMRWVIGRAAKASRAVITPTDWVKRQIIEQYHVDEKKVTATHEAVDPLSAQPASIEALGVKQPFLLYLGNAYEYKNLPRLIEAFAKLNRLELSLVLAGKKDYFYQKLEESLSEFNLDNRLIFTGFVNDGQAMSLYKQAELFVFPSLAEGFGLPALEAMAQGTPVLSSNASCMPEVYGDAAAYFDPLDESDIAKQIENLLDDPQKRAELSKRGLEHVKKFSWQKTATQTLEVYKKS